MKNKGNVPIGNKDQPKRFLITKRFYFKYFEKREKEKTGWLYSQTAKKRITWVIPYHIIQYTVLGSMHFANRSFASSGQVGFYYMAISYMIHSTIHLNQSFGSGFFQSSMIKEEMAFLLVDFSIMILFVNPIDWIAQRQEKGISRPRSNNPPLWMPHYLLGQFKTPTPLNTHIYYDYGGGPSIFGKCWYLTLYNPCNNPV